MIALGPVATANVEDFIPPPCLRRRGPAQLDLIDERGLRPTLGRGGFQLRAGRRYTVRVRPQRSDEFGQVTQAVVERSECLRNVIPPGEVQTKEGAEYVSILRPHRPFFLPARTGLIVTLHHNRWGPFSVSVPIVVWPRVWSQVSLALAVPLTAAAQRLSTHLAKDGSTLVGVLWEEAQNPTFWLQSLLFVILAFTLVRTCGWCWAAVGARTD
jgi:hypothetical protein